jgi:hypothetical protein
MSFFFKYKPVSALHLFYVLVFFVTSSSLVQSQEITIADSIVWNQPIPSVDPISGKHISRLFFNKAVFHDSVALPFYQVKIPLRSELTGYSSFRTTNVRSCEMTLQELSLLGDRHLLSDSIIIRQSFVTEKKTPYILVSFVPIRKNRISGKYERILSFSLISYSSGRSRTKSAQVNHTFTGKSLLSSGDWYKFLVSKTGVYKVSFGEIKNLGIKNPENIRIYGYGGKKLQEVFSGVVPDDMLEIPVMINAQNNGTYTDNDYILFYAQGPVTWNFDPLKKTFSHQVHPFTDQSAYFMTSEPGGKKITTQPSPQGNPNNTVTSFDGLDYHEADLVNFLRSGRNWYGEEFGVQSAYDFTFAFPNIVAGEPVKLEGELLSRSGYASSFTIRQNNLLVDNISLPGITIDDLSDYAAVKKFQSAFTSSSEKITVRLSFDNNGVSSAKGWLNYIRIAARENLQLNSSQLLFRDSKSVGTGNIAGFTISNGTSATLVWDVTDITNVQQIPLSNQNGTLSFNASADNLCEYVAFDPKNGLSPTFIKEDNGKVPNQNLHGFPSADFIIISHPDFLKQANELAEIHRQHDNLSIIVVTPQQIYNEFSSGMTDPAAIRNFIKMFYDRADDPAKAPKYVLLFGDGSYDNKNSVIGGIKNTNFIPTYESENSISPTYSYVSDDYYGLLDDGERISDGLLDVGIGRFPVQDTIHAEHLIDKIKSYMSAKNYGDWRNSICFIADDEDNNIHMEQADQLATYMETNHSSFNIEKIYLDAYQQVSTSSGDRYPDVNTAITNQVNKGTLIINYTGHGGESGLAHELILRQKEDIDQWANNTYPLFITATCDLSRFDDYQKTTAGEDILLNLQGGGIALLTTTRLVYSGPNFVLNQQFYLNGFTKTSENPAFRLGDIFRITKNNSGTDINKLNFTLLGDPALSLAIPKYQVVTDSINHNSSIKGDTLQAYSQVVLKGRIVDESGQKLTNFNGILYPTVFDKTKKITTLANDGGQPFDFNLQNNVLFKGKTSVKNGEFTSNLIMPRDMDYTFGIGKISYYASDSISDAAGMNNSVVIGGLLTGVSPNSKGPDIRLFLNDTTFKDGGISNEFPVLLALVSDENGINPGGNGLGHDIIAVLDNDPNQTFILNSYFETNIDDFRKGIVEFRFPKLSSGEHSVSFKLWDNFNNSSQAVLHFTVLGGNSVSLQRVYTYPNPANDYTNFFFEHNQTNSEFDVAIEIYNLSGSLITRLNQKISPSGYTSGPMYWNLTNQNNNKILPGIYLYRIIVRSLNEISVSSSNKLVVIN